jgi:hypothetical protein
VRPHAESTFGVGECCPQAFATRRSELEGSECWYEVLDGNHAEPSGLPQRCFPSCDEQPCPPQDVPGPFGVAVADESGTCQLEPSCDDASCPGSPCNPVIGCDTDWLDPVDGERGLQCQAESCGGRGTCMPFVEYSGCGGEAYSPVCDCRGVSHDEQCKIGYSSPILYDGPCGDPQGGPDPATPNPNPSPPEGADECVVALNADECCPLAHAARRSEVQADPCRFEVVGGDADPRGKVPEECFPTCPASPAPS